MPRATSWVKVLKTSEQKHRSTGCLEQMRLNVLMRCCSWRLSFLHTEKHFVVKQMYEGKNVYFFSFE